MKPIKNLLILTFMLFVTTSMFALSQDAPVDYSDPNYWVITVTPLLVLGASALLKYVLPKIPGVLMLTIVAAVSALLAFLNTSLLSPDLNWLESFGLGISATFIHQIYKQLNQ